MIKNPNKNDLESIFFNLMKNYKTMKPKLKKFQINDLKMDKKINLEKQEKNKKPENDGFEKFIQR